jgi:hypothetical protein
VVGITDLGLFVCSSLATSTISLSFSHFCLRDSAKDAFVTSGWSFRELIRAESLSSAILCNVAGSAWSVRGSYSRDNRARPGAPDQPSRRLTRQNQISEALKATGIYNERVDANTELITRRVRGEDERTPRELPLELLDTSEHGRDGRHCCAPT